MTTDTFGLNGRTPASEAIHSPFIRKYKNFYWLLVALLVAFALRVAFLDAQSLWNDEGTSVALSSLSLEAIINGAARDIHPPLYYFLLHFWMSFAGQTEFAVRFLSVIAGGLTVAVTYRIARAFFDEEVANIAAFLAAFSPFQVYYSQEARMYIWVTLFAAISVWAMGRILNPKSQMLNSKRGIWNLGFAVWLLYIIATIAALYTQYVGAFVVLAENLTFAVWWLLTIRNSQFAICNLVHWLIAQLVIGLAFLPWYLFAGGQLTSWPSISEPLDLPTLLWRVLNVFSVGLTMTDERAAAVASAFAVLFFLGWSRARNAHSNWGTLTLILWALAPVAVMYIVSLSRPAYNPKFLLPATPAFYILAARGLAEAHPGVFLQERRHKTLEPPIIRNVFWIISILAVGGVFPSLSNYYFDPHYARDDYRAMMRFIDTNERVGDGILINAPGQIDVVRYYRRGNQQLFLLPRMRPPDPTATRADVDELVGKTQRLFAIYWSIDQSDPQRIVETRLAERAFKARDEWHGNVRLGLYGSAPNPRGASQTISTRFSDAIELLSYQLDAREARAGDVLTLTLNWRVDQSPSTRYKVFVHLLDAESNVVAQRDGEPVGDLRPMPTWRVGEIIADHYGVFVEPGIPPGDYRIEVGMYRADNGVRLSLGERDYLMLGMMKVIK